MSRRLFLKALVGLTIAPVAIAAEAKTKSKKQVVTKPTAKTTKTVRKSVKIKEKPAVHSTRHAAVTNGPLRLESRNAIVWEEKTGLPLFVKNQDERVPIASITKVMTAMVVLDLKQSMNEDIVITEADIDEIKGSHSRLSPGSVLSRHEALLLALMSSENRAANALGRNHPDGLHAFVRAMNKKAQEIGMTNSHFVDPTGLSPANISTAGDLAKMLGAAAKYDRIRQYSTTTDFNIHVGVRDLAYKNTNPLVRSDSWDIHLSKTGYTKEAGRCLVMRADIGNSPVRIVLLDSANKQGRIADAQRIRQWLLTKNA